MKAVELLETYPRAAEVINEFYHTKMIESMDTSDVSQEYKDLLKEQEFDNEYVATFVDANPRMLFDVFDENDISINIIRTNNSTEEWDWALVPGPQENSVCKSRKEAELFAIEAAFEILEEQLTPKEESNENE